MFPVLCVTGFDRLPNYLSAKVLLILNLRILFLECFCSLLKYLA